MPSKRSERKIENETSRKQCIIHMPGGVGERTCCDNSKRFYFIYDFLLQAHSHTVAQLKIRASNGGTAIRLWLHCAFKINHQSNRKICIATAFTLNGNDYFVFLLISLCLFLPFWVQSRNINAFFFSLLPIRSTVRVCLNYVWNILKMTTERIRTAPAAAAKRIQRQIIASAHVKRDFASVWNIIRQTLTPRRRARSAMSRHRWLVKIQWIWQRSVSSSIPASLIPYDFRFILRGRWVNNNQTKYFFPFFSDFFFYSFMIDAAYLFISVCIQF